MHGTGGMHGKGVCMPRMPPGRYYEIRCYGKSAGGTHPTGMHSCYYKLLVVHPDGLNLNSGCPKAKFGRH